MFGANLPRSSAVVRWMARFGMRSSGRLMCTSFFVNAPSASLMMTAPASVSSRSNHVCHSPPPYASTLIWMQPCALFFEHGLSLSTGESVCAATMLKPFPASNAAPTKKATTQPPRT